MNFVYKSRGWTGTGILGLLSALSFACSPISPSVDKQGTVKAPAPVVVESITPVVITVNSETVSAEKVDSDDKVIPAGIVVVELSEKSRTAAFEEFIKSGTTSIQVAGAAPEVVTVRRGLRDDAEEKDPKAKVKASDKDKENDAPEKAMTFLVDQEGFKTELKISLAEGKVWNIQIQDTSEKEASDRVRPKLKFLKIRIKGDVKAIE